MLLVAFQKKENNHYKLDAIHQLDSSIHQFSDSIRQLDSSIRHFWESIHQINNKSENIVNQCFRFFY